MLFLPDTSVWIDFLGKGQGPEVGKLKRLIELETEVCICGPTLTETLQGIRSTEQFTKVARILESFTYLEADRMDFLKSAEIYRTCRANGSTIRKTLDCLIAAIALRADAFVMYSDRDFEAIARFFPLKIY